MISLYLSRQLSMFHLLHQGCHFRCSGVCAHSLWSQREKSTASCSHTVSLFYSTFKFATWTRVMRILSSSTPKKVHKLDKVNLLNLYSDLCSFMLSSFEEIIWSAGEKKKEIEKEENIWRRKILVHWGEEEQEKEEEEIDWRRKMNGDPNRLTTGWI